MRKLPYFIDLFGEATKNHILSADFPINTLTINNTSDSVISVYKGRKSVGIGALNPDYVIYQYNFADLPFDGEVDITIVWTNPTSAGGSVRFDLSEEHKPFYVQSNPPNGGSGPAANVVVTNSLPPGTNMIGHVIVDSAGGDPAKNGTQITGENLSAGGSGVLGWLSEIATRLLTNLHIDVKAFTASLPGGVNHLGEVSVNTLPAGLAQDSTVAKLGQAASLGVVGSQQVAVPVAAGQIVLNVPATAKSVMFKNPTTGATFTLGKDATVTAANGYPLSPAESFAFDIVPGSAITVYGIASVAGNLAVLYLG